MRFQGPVGPPSHSCAVPSVFGVSLTLLQIDARVHEVSWSVKVMYGSMGLGVSATLNQVYLQAHSDSGSPGTSIKFIYRSMTFQGPLGPLSNWYASPWDIRVPSDLVRMYMQAHDVARSLGTFLQICLQAHEMSGARRTSFTFIVRPISFRGLLDPDSN